MSHRGAGPALILVGALLSGCGAAEHSVVPASTATASMEVPSTAPSSAPSSAPSIPSIAPSQAPPSVLPSAPSATASAPSAPDALPDFTMPAPPESSAAWTGITWHKLKQTDPLASIRSITRWHGGYVALGATIATGDTSRTPVWISAEGVSWRPLPLAVLGPAAIVVGIVATPGAVVAITLQGGTNQCDGEDIPSCWSLAGPLESWTSTDGSRWATHPGPPSLALPAVGCDSCGVTPPNLRSGSPGLVLFGDAGRAFSADGTSWEELPDGSFPANFELSDVAALGSGLIAVGRQSLTLNGQETSRPVALSSSDGRAWSLHVISTPSSESDPGETAGNLVAGAHGLIAVGHTGGDPGLVLWWSSTTGTTWSALSSYPPLGVWLGEGVGSGDIPNGYLLADGVRMLAYRDGSTASACLSADGRTWQRINVGSGGPSSTPGYGPGEMRMTPVGVLATGNDLSSWFGQPTT